jgi:TfuA protein
MSPGAGEGVLFIGPSWPLARDAVPPSIRLRPPVRRGDVLALLEEAVLPRAIGIVDGAFNESLSVSPKEVIKALDLGVGMFGSSSMGALRAVECEPFGMIGVGRIFATYRSGQVDADDEVAIIYDPETLHGLTEPLVSLRLNMADAVEGGHVAARDAERLLAVAKKLYFPHRSLLTILRLFEEQVGPHDAAPARSYLHEQAIDVKRADAEQLLHAMIAYLASEPPDGVQRADGR